MYGLLSKAAWKKIDQSSQRLILAWEWETNSERLLQANLREKGARDISCLSATINFVYNAKLTKR